ncbi:MAG TPA: hypothetical protein VEA77_06010 [Hyphomicrobium sp.]|nr:hypothetical protein [Hyphomicrobium sp.]
MRAKTAAIGLFIGGSLLVAATAIAVSKMNSAVGATISALIVPAAPKCYDGTIEIAFKDGGAAIKLGPRGSAEPERSGGSLGPNRVEQGRMYFVFGEDACRIALEITAAK